MAQSVEQPAGHPPSLAEIAQVLRFDEAAGRFFRIDTGKPAGGIRGNGYHYTGVLGRAYLTHRLAWLFKTGEWPKSSVDHINGDTTDNRPENLRVLSHAENMQNIRKAHRDNQTGLLGVSKCGRSKKWVAVISIAGARKRLGRFNSPQEAHQAYVAAKRKHHSACTI